MGLLADDPNDPVPIAHRARVLEAAWPPDIPDRLTFLESRCRGRSLLDVGCVAHAEARLESDEWLHGRLARVAARCVGVDILESGVEAVRAAGFDAVVHDLRDGLGPLAERGPFDVIVAGELIEHVPDLDMILATAAEGLPPDGELILTTPNPYAPQRVRAGQLGIVWENVDHVSYLFPSGMAELAERRGLVLAQAATIARRPRPGATATQRLKRRFAGATGAMSAAEPWAVRARHSSTRARSPDPCADSFDRGRASSVRRLSMSSATVRDGASVPLP